MVQIQQRLLTAALLLASSTAAQGPKFYPDDPLWKEPQPRSAGILSERKLSDYYDFLLHTFSRRGEHQRGRERILAKNVNTLSEVPDSSWYTNRHRRRPMSLEEVVRGPDTVGPPSVSGPWIVTKAKSEGVTPGFEIDDPQNMHYRIKFDPLDNPEMSTAAEVIGAALFHTLGYNVPENHLVYFERKQLVLAKKASFRDKLGRKRVMSERDLEDILVRVPRGRDGRYRAIASLEIPVKPYIGEFQFYGTRKDDPNDTVPHEHRRELRGYFVFCAWLHHEDSRAINTLDGLVEEDGVRFVKHYLVDFGSILGSASTQPNSPRSGNQYLFAPKSAVSQFITLGLYVPRWARARYPDLPSVGRFEYRIFDPEKFKPEYPNPAFENRLPDDTFWAAKQVMAITDDQIRAVVKKAQYSDPEAAQWVAECLIARKQKIGQTYFANVLPLDRFRVAGGRLEFQDLAVEYGLSQPRQFGIRWFAFDNRGLRMTPLGGQEGAVLPPAVAKGLPGQYYAAEIRGDDSRKSVIAYLRAQDGGPTVVGIDRKW